jgi:acetylglutamate kinase
VQVFNVVSEQLASEAAAALSASKLIFITAGQTLVDSRTHTVIQSMRVRDITCRDHATGSGAGS